MDEEILSKKVPPLLGGQVGVQDFETNESENERSANEL